MRRTTSVIAALVAAAFAASLAGCAQPPTISVTPSTDLITETSVNVSGSGYPAGASIQTLQCRAGAHTTADCDTVSATPAFANSQGRYTGSQIVRVDINTANGPVDCRATGSCVIGSALASSTSVDVTAPIEFRKVPTATVTPNSGLLDGTEVQFAMRNFPPNHDYVVRQCAVGRELTDGCTVGPLVTATTDSAGMFFARVFVTDGFTDQVGGMVDCTQPVACDITIHDPATGSNKAFLHTEFLPYSGLTVTPDRDLGDGQVVRVQGPQVGGGNKVMQCPSGISDYSTQCDMGTLRYIDSTGQPEFDIQMTLVGTLQDSSGHTTDCTVPGACMIISDLNHGSSIMFPSWHPLEFDEPR